jgi:hypothetical protein
MTTAWPLCEIHHEADGACLPCHEHQLVRDDMPLWTWRLHASVLLSIGLGCDHLAAAQTRTLARAAIAAAGRVRALAAAAQTV